MNNLVLDKNFISSIDYFDNIMLLDSFENENKVYNMVVDYLKRDTHYLLKLNILDNNKEILNTECKLTNKKNGSIVIKDIISLVTKKYNNDLIIDVKELDQYDNCVKFGRRTYISKKWVFSLNFLLKKYLIFGKINKVLNQINTFTDYQT